MPQIVRTVATVLLPAERQRVEAAGHGAFVAVHADSLDDAVSTVRRRGVHALVVSLQRCGEPELPRVARFVREFPQVPAVALVTRPGTAPPDRLLRLGAHGVRAVVDVSDPDGWRRLRDLLQEPVSPVVAAVMAALDPDLKDVPPDCRLFFELVIRRAPEIRSVSPLAAALRVLPSTLCSRFFRSGLPSPKIYLAQARLVHAAYLFANGGLSVSDVSHRLDYTSPQSFGRHLRTHLGMTPGEFRRRLPFSAAVARYRVGFVTPYRDRLLTFHPLGTLPGDHGRSAA